MAGRLGVLALNRMPDAHDPAVRGTGSSTFSSARSPECRSRVHHRSHTALRDKPPISCVSNLTGDYSLLRN